MNKYAQFSGAGAVAEAPAVPSTTPTPRVSEKFLSGLEGDLRHATEHIGSTRRAQCGTPGCRIAVDLKARTRHGEIIVDASYGRLDADNQLTAPAKVELHLGAPEDLKFSSAMTQLTAALRQRFNG